MRYVDKYDSRDHRTNLLQVIIGAAVKKAALDALLWAKDNLVNRVCGASLAEQG